MEQQQVPKKRVRINVSTSVKGVKTWDATVELVDDANIYVDNDLPARVLAESDWLVAELDKRYPAPEVGL